MATAFEWHKGHAGLAPRNPPETTERLQAFGNIQFLDAMDMIDGMWKDIHPEILFVANSEANIADTEKGYVVYSTQQKTTKDNNPKPRFQENITTTGDVDGLIFSQSFIHDVRFTAMHKNPRVAEEVLDAFEDFMYPASIILKLNGIEDIFYHLRPTDRHENRMSKDMESRAVIYRMYTQRVFYIETWRLEQMGIRASTLVGSATPGTFLEVNV